MVSPGNNPNQGNQKSGKENSNAADKPERKDESSGNRQSQQTQDGGQVGNTQHGG